MNPSKVRKCRYCTQNQRDIYPHPACLSPDCQEKWQNSCKKVQPCGHYCGGISDEEKCLPCLHCYQTGNKNLNQAANDQCMICFTETLSAAPSIQLKCGHVFHYHCVRSLLEKRWAGPRISFSFNQCPQCKTEIEHQSLGGLLEPVREFYADIERKALMRLQYEGLQQTEEITAPGSRFYGNPAGFAMDRYSYYLCSKCNKAYCGGDARCIDQICGADYKPDELVCGACSDVTNSKNCPKHGTEFIEYKCRYCCSVATYYCFGTTHFCTVCHDNYYHVTNIMKELLPKCPAGPNAQQLSSVACPLGISHPPTGEEFSLGCGLCRNIQLF